MAARGPHEALLCVPEAYIQFTATLHIFTSSLMKFMPTLPWPSNCHCVAADGPERAEALSFSGGDHL